VESADHDRERAVDFERRAMEKQSGPVRELWLFLRENKKWWLMPMIAILLLLGALVILGGSPAAPFIYTLF
jgi:hypothetical protein